MRVWNVLGLGLGLGLGCVAPSDCNAQTTQTPVTTVEDIVVEGRGEHRIGRAVSASEGAVSGEDLLVRPLSRTGELVEAVPGLLAVQHSGGGKANQYFLRGYNLDHGTDFSLALDGVPMNLRSQGHAQGYLDLNGLIPETVARIDYRKGPYRADVGDFSLVAHARVSTRDTFERPFIGVEFGSYAYGRIVAGGSVAVGPGMLLLAGEAKRGDGPWALPEDLRHLSLFGKYAQDTGRGTLSVSLSVYDAQWHPTEQIPVRAIGPILADRFGTLDTFLRGETQRQILTVGLDDGQTSAVAYVQHYDFALISNFTFFLDDPVNGDELEQVDRRWTYGGKVQRRIDLTEDWTLLLGADAVHDQISDLALYQTRFGQRIATRNRYVVQQTSGGAFVEATWNPTDRLSLFGGLRGDAFRFTTRARGGAAADGRVNDTIVSPKIGASYRVAEGLAVYANYGQGFHSNAARGVTDPVTPAPALVRGTGQEVGVRLERGPVVVTLDLWSARSDSELLYSGDAGTVEPSGPSARRGYEATLFFRPWDWLEIDAVWAESHTRFRDAPGFDRIPGALENTGEFGAAAVFPTWNAAVRVRHLGPHALTEDNLQRGPSTTLVNLRGAWTPGRIEVFAAMLNVLDSEGADSDFYYASRLPGEPPEGVEGLHSRSVEPRTVRIGIKAMF